MRYTFITIFDSEGYRKIDNVLTSVTERMSRIPYGKVDEDKRYLLDTLPYHFTVSSTKKDNSVWDQMDDFVFQPFSLKVKGVEIMNGREGSQILYFSIGKSTKFDELQNRLFDKLNNDYYKPGKHRRHITICISKNHNKINAIKTEIEKNFEPFTLKVIALGMFEIWPGMMRALYPFTGNKSNH